MNEIEKIKDLMFRMGEYLPKTQYIRESKELLSEAHENIDTLLTTRYKDIGKDTAMKLLLFDPTYQKGPLVKGEYPNPSKKAGNYGVWILDRYLNGEITLDDGDKVYKTLNVFKNIGKRLKNSNINAYSSFQELYDEVLPFINGEKNMNTHSAMVDKYRHIPDTEIPYEDDFWLVVTPFNEAASCQVGGGTKWCTAARESENRFWHYAAYTPLFVIINKSKNGVKYQYNTWSKEFKDVQNDDVDMDSVGLSPKLLEWIKKGANEYKEKYLQEIKPYKKERIRKIEQRLANGEDPKKIFNEVGEFEDGFARIKLDGKGWNYLTLDRTLLWHGNTWFDECDDFKKGFVLVQYEGEWCYLTQSGDLISMEQYIQQIEQRLANGEDPKKIFNYVGAFVNGFAMVKINRKGWNFLKPDGTLLWTGDTWFNSCYDFQNGFASVLYKGEWRYLTQNGDLISTKQYFQQIEQRLANGEDPKKIFNEVGEFENGFAIVRLDRIGWNYLKEDGTFLWKGERWFDDVWDFKNGFARVNTYGKGYNFLKRDGTLLWNGERWFDTSFNFYDRFAEVKLDGKGYNYLKTDGTLLWDGDTWFDSCDDFHDGLVLVRIEGKGWNFLKADGTLLWNGDKWFTWCYNFENKSASVKYNGAIYRITESCDLIPIDQYVQQIRQRISDGEDTKSLFDWCDDFKDGFARVRINGKGENFLKDDGTLLWQCDIWFVACDDFRDGVSNVCMYNNEWKCLKADGTLE